MRQRIRLLIVIAAICGAPFVCMIYLGASAEMIDRGWVVGLLDVVFSDAVFLGLFAWCIIVTPLVEWLYHGLEPVHPARSSLTRRVFGVVVGGRWRRARAWLNGSGRAWARLNIAVW